jgi:hypothetical protein
MGDGFDLDQWLGLIFKTSKITGRDVLEYVIHPEKMVPYIEAMQIEELGTIMKTQMVLISEVGIASFDAVFAVPVDDDDSEPQMIQRVRKGRNRVEPEFIGQMMAVLFRDGQDRLLRQRMFYFGGRRYLKEEIPTVQIKIVKRNDPEPYWVVQLTDVRIFEDDSQNEPGFVTYNLRFLGACTIVDNRPADAA